MFLYWHQVLLSSALSSVAPWGASSDQPGVPLSGSVAPEEEADSYPGQAQLFSQPVEYHEELHWQRAVQDPDARQYFCRDYPTFSLTDRKLIEATRVKPSACCVLLSCVSVVTTKHAANLTNYPQSVKVISVHTFILKRQTSPKQSYAGQSTFF